MWKNNDDNYRKTVIVLIVVLVILFVWTIISFVQWFNNPNSKEISLVHGGNSVTSENQIDRDKIIEDINNKTKSVNIVATLEDKISENALWCPTFQLVWNDLQDNFTDGEVKFESGNNILVKNLNKQTFKEKGLSKEYYYKKYGIFDVKLKEEIENGIKDKFNETSDILNEFEWPKESEDNDLIFFYSMLKREFTYNKEFEVIENKKFKDVEDVKYFGVYSETPQEVKNQVRVLYYNNENDFAVSLNTKEKDQVIVAKGPAGKTFNDCFEYVNKNDQKYKGSRTLKDNETMAIPMLNIDKTRSYDELLNHTFIDKDGKEREIAQALQTCKFEINEKGGKVKSEAGMAVVDSAVEKGKEKLRIFDVDNDFVIMLKEPKQPLPYFMAKVSDINLFR